MDLEEVVLVLAAVVQVGRVSPLAAPGGLVVLQVRGELFGVDGGVESGGCKDQDVEAAKTDQELVQTEGFVGPVVGCGVDGTDGATLGANSNLVFVFALLCRRVWSVDVVLGVAKLELRKSKKKKKGDRK